MRSIYGGTLNKSQLDQEVTLCGWVDRRRDHGGVIFIDLRDREGIVQVVFDPDTKANFELADKVRSEYVLQVTGKVRARSDATVNANMAIGSSPRENARESAFTLEGNQRHSKLP